MRSPFYFLCTMKLATQKDLILHHAARSMRAHARKRTRARRHRGLLTTIKYIKISLYLIEQHIKSSILQVACFVPPCEPSQL